MATYCTLDDVKRALVNITIDETSKPSEVDIEGAEADPGPPEIEEQIGYIDLVSAQIEGALDGAGITLPITDETKLLLLTRIAVDGVAAMVLRATGVEPEQAAEFQKAYEKALQRIRDYPEEFSIAEIGAAIGGRIGTEDRHWRREEQDW